jgi:hypothetical protein
VGKRRDSSKRRFGKRLLKYILVARHKGSIMMRLVTSTFLLSLVLSGAHAESAPPSTKRLPVFRTEQGARQHCPNDTIVWASTTSHALYGPGNKHFAHTSGGFACESEGRAKGYQGPTAHT